MVDVSMLTTALHLQLVYQFLMTPKPRMELVGLYMLIIVTHYSWIILFSIIVKLVQRVDVSILTTALHFHLVYQFLMTPKPRKELVVLYMLIIVIHHLPSLIQNLITLQVRVMGDAFFLILEIF
jgi:hypothetical protein